MIRLRWMVSVLILAVITSVGTTAAAQGTAGETEQNDEETAGETDSEEAAAEDTTTDESASDETTSEVTSPEDRSADDTSSEDQTETTQASVKAPGEMGFDFDLMIAAGLGSWLYPHIEPGVDIGVAPLGPVTISVGASLDLGYCLLCGIIAAASPNWRIRSWYGALQGRALIHVNQLSRALADTINADFYAGMALGPALYNFTLGYEPTNEEAAVNFVTILGGPVFGAKFFADNIGLFGYAELRYLLEAGFSETTVELDNQEFTLTNDYRRSGSDLVFGLGYRF